MIISYTVLNIFRISDQSKTFIMCLYNEEMEFFRIDKSLSDSISRGMVFIGDNVTIKTITNDGIIFEICSDTLFIDSAMTYTEIDFIYSEVKKVIKPQDNNSNNYLPYLCDVLPYNTEEFREASAKPIFKNNLFIGKYLVDLIEVSNIKTPLPSSFIAKVVQKTRINIYPTSYNPFFFAIVSSNDIFIKVVFWMESLKRYSSLKVGDIILVKDFKMKKKWNAFDKVDLNTFTESIYFDVDEITAKEILKIKYDKKRTTPCLFEVVEGYVEYLSIIMRFNINGTLLEYVLMNVDDKKVILFYNSDLDFYKIQPKMKIKICELRKLNRAGLDMFVSTIYTQFEFVKDIIMEDLELKDMELLDECTNDQNKFDNLSPKKSNKNVENNGEDPEVVAKKWVFGALGFIPDNFVKMSDIIDYQKKEKINGTAVSFNLFMKPVVLTIDELKKQTLVLNEVKKYIINTKIIKITDVDCIVSYFENGQTKQQGSFQLVLEDNFKIYVYKNFFVQELDSFSCLESFDKSNSIVGKELSLAIEAFRADETNIIYYLTGIIHP